MAPQHVKPFVQGNKTDARDAAAIAEAAGRESVPSVAIRNIEGQQMQALHRVRELWMKQRVAVSNQIRGLLAGFGEVMPLPTRSSKRTWRCPRHGHLPELAVLEEVIEQLVSALRRSKSGLACWSSRSGCCTRAMRRVGLLKAFRA
ncbi:MAG: transposase [Uliginosibacterium sp.]|nr:transposase [Uliginosibacterium sp.]